MGIIKVIHTQNVLQSRCMQLHGLFDGVYLIGLLIVKGILKRSWALHKTVLETRRLLNINLYSCVCISSYLLFYLLEYFLNKS